MALRAAPAPSHERQQAIMAVLAELALESYRGNGRVPADDVAWVLQAIAVRAPATAARCPRLRAALPADVLAAVLRLAGAPGVTDGAAPAGHVPAWLTVAQVADLTGLTRHGVRDRCRRGQLAARKVRAIGEWRIDPRSVAERRADGQQES